MLIPTSSCTCYVADLQQPSELLSAVSEALVLQWYTSRAYQVLTACSVQGQPPAEAVTKNPTSSSSNVLGRQTEDVNSLFTLGKVLGKGQFGVTRVAEEKSTGSIYACKSIAKRKLQYAPFVDQMTNLD